MSLPVLLNPAVFHCHIGFFSHFNVNSYSQWFAVIVVAPCHGLYVGYAVMELIIHQGFNAIPVDHVHVLI